MNNFEDIYDIFECHPGWRFLPLDAILKQAQQCIEDGCMTEDDLKIITDIFREEDDDIT